MPNVKELDDAQALMFESGVYVSSFCLDCHSGHFIDQADAEAHREYFGHDVIEEWRNPPAN